MDGSDADVLDRMRDNAGSFEAAGTASLVDERVNDGNNYRGLMSVADYKNKRTEIIEDTAAKREQDRKDKMSSALNADKTAADMDKAAAAERERVRKEKLKRQLEEAALFSQIKI